MNGHELVVCGGETSSRGEDGRQCTTVGGGSAVSEGDVRESD